MRLEDLTFREGDPAEATISITAFAVEVHGSVPVTATRTTPPEDFDEAWIVSIPDRLNDVLFSSFVRARWFAVEAARLLGVEAEQRQRTDDALLALLNNRNSGPKD